VFIATPGWSRATFVKFVTDERMETLLGRHERAFYFSGGIPREVLYDNTRTVVTERGPIQIDRRDIQIEYRQSQLGT
jgi:transposase